MSTEPLVIELEFGAVPVTVTIGLDDIFALAPGDRDALFAFVDMVKTAAGNGAAPRPPTPPRPAPKPRPVMDRTHTIFECDQCDKTFTKARGLSVHKTRAHTGNVWSKKGKAVAPAPAPDIEVQLTCETCSAPLTTIEKLKAHTVARHGRDPRPTELVENRGPR